MFANIVIHFHRWGALKSNQSSFVPVSSNMLPSDTLWLYFVCNDLSNVHRSGWFIIPFSEYMPVKLAMRYSVTLVTARITGLAMSSKYCCSRYQDLETLSYVFLGERPWNPNNRPSYRSAATCYHRTHVTVLCLQWFVICPQTAFGSSDPDSGVHACQDCGASFRHPCHCTHHQTGDFIQRP